MRVAIDIVLHFYNNTFHQQIYGNIFETHELCKIRYVIHIFNILFMRLTWHGGDSNSAVFTVHIAGNANYANNRTPKAFDQNSFAQLFVKWNTFTFVHYTQKIVESCILSHIFLLGTSGDGLKFTDYSITTRSRHDNNKPASLWSRCDYCKQ